MVAKGILRAMGEELRSRRVAKGLSQEALAEKAGLHRNFVGLLERGERNPTLLTLCQLAVALRTSASDLIAASEERV
jgi:transcriptional regulator with XRE-family HTH domain